MSANSRNGHDRHIALPDDLKSGLDEFFTTVKNRLLCGPPTEIKYPGAKSQCWPAAEIESANTRTFDSLDNDGNLYAIFAEDGNGIWIPKYVGTITCKELKKRMKEHLVDNKRTKSKLCKVKREVSNGTKIAISYVRIEPENLRVYMEKRIISEERGRESDRLSWNQRR